MSQPNVLSPKHIPSRYGGQTHTAMLADVCRKLGMAEPDCGINLQYNKTNLLWASLLANIG